MNSPLNPPPHRFLPLLLATAVFMQLLDATVLNTALPAMAADLHESPLQMQSAVVSYALTLALLMPVSGWLCDRFGIRQVFFAAMLVFVAGSALCAWSDNLPFLVASRVLQGVGGAMMSPVPRLVMVRAYDKSRLISMMNYVVTPALVGPVIGPIVGGYLVQYASWHWIFLINLPVGLAAAWLTLAIMPDFPRVAGVGRFDFVGFVLFGAGALGVSIAVEMFQRGHSAVQTVALMVLSVLAFAGYVRHAKRIEQPLYDKNLLKVRTYRLGLSGNLVSRIGMSSLPFLLPMLLQVGFGYSATVAGWALAPIAAASIFAKPLIKPLVMRWGYRRVLVANTCIIGVQIIMMALLRQNTPLWIMLPFLLLVGACNSIQFTTMNTITLADVRPYQAASGTSLMSVNQQLAVGFGTAISAALLHYFTSSQIFGGSVQGAFCWTFVVIGGSTCLSAWIFARLNRRDGENLIER